MNETNEDWDKIGKRLKEAREYRGYSQLEIADWLDISRPSVSLMENGERKVDSIELQKLSDLYNVSIDRLIREPEAEHEDIELLARAAEDLSKEDREEVLRFAQFLQTQDGDPQEND